MGNSSGMKALEKRLRNLHDSLPPQELARRLERDIPSGLADASGALGPGSVPPPGRRMRLLLTAASLGVAAVAVAAWLVIGVAGVGTADAQMLSAVLAPVLEATANVQAVHVVVEMRVREGETLGYVNVRGGLKPVEAWLVQSSDGRVYRARADKGDRVWIFDGKGHLAFYRRLHEARRDTGFDYEILWPAGWLRDLLTAPPDDVEILEREGDAAEGRILVAQKGIGGEPHQPVFWPQFDRETEITWGPPDGRLTSLRRWVRVSGRRLAYLETSLVEYLPSIEEEVFHLDLPEDVRWVGLAPLSQDSVREQERMGPRDAVVKIFQAATGHDRETLEQFIESPALVDWFLTHEIDVVSVGEPVQIGGYPGYLVPYVVRVRWGGIFHYTKRHRFAIRNDNREKRWTWDGGW